MKKLVALSTLAFAFVASAAAAQDKGAGKAVYDKTCALCHGSGLAGAPRYGQAAEWSARLKAGMPRLYESALKGTPRGMPGKGGNMSLADADVKAAVDYLVASVGAAKVASAPAPGAEKKVAAAPAAPASAPAAQSPARPLVPVVAPLEAPAAPVAPPPAAGGDPNSFNRLMAAPGKRNPPPAEDGIHDAANPGTLALQPPLTSFKALPPLNAGNRINWVKSLGDSKIKPRWDKESADAQPVVMDLNIVREVKGSMPDVVYPHKQHTEWLDCSACHPAIFIPQKGANQISMASIMLGQKCGVCHGKVAFPVSECRLCHSKNKDPAARTAEAKP